MGLCATDLSAHRPHARTHARTGLCVASTKGLQGPLGPCQAGPGPHMGPWAHARSGPSQGRAGFRSTLGPVDVFLLFSDLFRTQKRPKIPETCHFSKTFLNFRRNRQPEFPAMGRRPMGAPAGPGHQNRVFRESAPRASPGPWGPLGAHGGPYGPHMGPHGAPMGPPMGPLWAPRCGGARQGRLRS